MRSLNLKELEEVSGALDIKDYVGVADNNKNDDNGFVVIRKAFIVFNTWTGVTYSFVPDTIATGEDKSHDGIPDYINDAFTGSNNWSVIVCWHC